MPLPVTSFAALAAGNQNLSLFDSQFNAVAAQGIIACSASFKNLSISVTSNTQIVVTADQVNLFDGVSNFASPTGINSTIATGTSGVNGLDTGTIASGTFYSVWVIQNTASGATAGLISTSATAPTMPTGYAKKARVGWVTTGSGTTNLMNTLQLGRRAQYVVTGVSPNTALPNIANGTAGTYSTTAPVWSANVSLAAFVPSTASEIFIVATQIWNSGAVSSFQVAPNANYAGPSSTNPPPFSSGLGSAGVSLTFSMELETLNLVWTSSAAGGGLSCLGWIDNI